MWMKAAMIDFAPKKSAAAAVGRPETSKITGTHTERPAQDAHTCSQRPPIDTCNSDMHNSRGRGAALHSA